MDENDDGSFVFDVFGVNVQVQAVLVAKHFVLNDVDLENKSGKMKLSPVSSQQCVTQQYP